MKALDTICPISIFYKLIHIFIYDFRNLEVALGDYVLNKDPDCTRNSIARLCHPPKIVRKVNGVVIHENYDPTNNYNNIALIRLKELVPLHTEDPIRHSIFFRTVSTLWESLEIWTGQNRSPIF